MVHREKTPQGVHERNTIAGRVTTLIAQKKSLFDRKRHECHLRSQAARTAQRFSHLQPAGFTVDAIPTQPARVHKVPDPSQRQQGRQATLGSWQQEQQAMLRDDKEYNARILVEQIIREDYTLEAYDLIKQYTETIIARFNVLVVEDNMRDEIAEAVAALLYSGYLLGDEVPELKQLYALFTAKYGKEFSQEVIANKDKYLNQLE